MITPENIQDGMIVFVSIVGFACIVLMVGAAFEKPKIATPFQKGDIVQAFGNTGTVHSIGKNGYVNVKFEECDSLVVFRTDGKLFGWNKHAALTKV